MEPKFKIEDRVELVKDGSTHTITDVLVSNGTKSVYYELDNDELFTEDSIREISPKSQPNGSDFSVEFNILDNIVIGILYKGRGDNKTEIARGHGHIIHQGETGVAQAISFAAKRIYQRYMEEN